MLPLRILRSHSVANRVITRLGVITCHGPFISCKCVSCRQQLLYASVVLRNVLRGRLCTNEGSRAVVVPRVVFCLRVRHVTGTSVLRMWVQLCRQRFFLRNRHDSTVHDRRVAMRHERLLNGPIHLFNVLVDGKNGSVRAVRWRVKVGLIFRRLRLVRHLLLLSSDRLLLRLQALRTVRRCLCLRGSGPIPQRCQRKISRSVPRVSVPTRRRRIRSMHRRGDRYDNRRGVRRGPRHVITLFRSFVCRISGPGISRPRPCTREGVRGRLRRSVHVPQLATSSIVGTPCSGRQSKGHRCGGRCMSLVPRGLWLVPLHPPVSEGQPHSYNSPVPHTNAPTQDGTSDSYQDA